MAGTDLNPPLLPSSYGNHIPSKTYPSLKPYTSSNYTTDMVQVNGPSYQSNNHAASIDRSRHQPHSPCNRLGSLASMGHAQRRKSSNSNSIASYLQIPSSINNSKGSLAEFAAQITCLFWFESSFTLHRVEEAKNTPIPTTPLVSDAMPSSGFLKWVTTILSTTQVTQNVILLALMFIYRLKNLNPTVKGKPGSEFRLLTVALMLGNKFLDDNTYTNKTWAEVSGISVQEIHIMEVEFLSNMRYSLFTSDQEWQEWHVKLGRFWNYFDKASRSPVEVAPRSLGPPTPALHMPPPLPSPPASTHASPPYMTTYSPTNSSYPHPFAVPAYFAPHLPSPASQMSEGDLRPTGRKRSHEDHMQEPPAKRITRPVAPSPASSLTLPPSTTPGVTSHMPRLPVPNLSISTSQPMHNFGSHTSTHLPPPAGRSMSMVYPGPTNYSQPTYVPSSAASTQQNAQSINLPPYSDLSRRQSPYTGTSATSSPTSASFPVHTPSQNQASPSFFLSQRNSPYRPVRSVNTLLVPPPSASMHNPPQNLGFDQMHYQPLGKSISERKTGVVPYMHHDTWPQLHSMQQWPPLPQPNFHS